MTSSSALNVCKGMEEEEEGGGRGLGRDVMTSCVAIGLLQAVTVNTTVSKSTALVFIQTKKRQCGMTSCSSLQAGYMI